MQNDPIQVIGWDRTKFNQEKEEGGHFINKVNSLEECASEMGCSFDTLKNTIDVYNRSVASGNDEEFGRRFMKGQFLSGPFYLFKCTPVVGITIGGLKVNQRMQVLNEYGEPISKLFAARRNRRRLAPGPHTSEMLLSRSAGPRKNGAANSLRRTRRLLRRVCSLPPGDSSCGSTVCVFEF